MDKFPKITTVYDRDTLATLEEYLEEALERPPPHVEEYEEDRHSGSPWWLDGYHAEDVANVAAYWRARLERVQAIIRNGSD